MKNMKLWKGLALSACVALAAVACGDDDPSKETNNTNVTTNNSTSNNMTTNNTTANNDLCAMVDCAANLPAPTCDGDVAVTSTSTGCDPETGMCGFDENREDCAANGETCSDGQCVVADLCFEVTCDTPEPSCNGDTAIVPGAESCNPANGMCEPDQPAQTTDCAANNQICVDGACVDDTGPCAGVSCDQPADGCDGQDLVTYSGAGVCDMATGDCDFTAVETRTDCTATGEICLAGACAADNDTSVSAGDLVITEYMQNPAAVSDNDGEWFEIYNATPRTLDINGLILDDGANQLTIAGAANVAGFSYVLVAKNADNATNGGLPPVDIEFSNISLANGDDTITIYASNGTDIIDQVAYDNGATFPDGNGVSGQFGAEFDVTSDDNADGSFWCPSRRTVYGAGDFGTPAAPNEVCLPAAVTRTVYDLQDENAADHPVFGTRVNVVDVIISATDGGDHLFVQEANGGQYSGIFVATDSVDISTFAVGDVVDIDGFYSEGSGTETTGTSMIEALSVTSKNMTGNVMPEVLTTEELSTEAGAEPWEGVLVQVLEPGVTDGSLSFGEFSIDANLLVDDLLYDYDTNVGDPANCWIFSQLTGPLDYRFGGFKIVPRDANDFVTADTTLTSSGAVGVSTVGAGGNSFTPGNICVDSGATVTWTWAGGFHDVESRDAGTNTPSATKALDSQDLQMAGDAFAFTFNDAGSYHYLCSYHPTAMTGQVIVLE